MTWPGWGRAAFVFVVAVLFGSAQAQIWTAPGDVPGGRPAAAALLAGITLPLLVMHRWPFAVFAVVLACLSGYAGLGGGLGQPWFAALLAVFGLGERGGRAAGVVGLGALAALVLAHDIPRLQAGEPIEDVLPAWFILAAAYGLGRWVRSRRRDVADLQAEAERLARDREAATAEAVAHEQARIARELHDLVAHALSVIVLQAQAGSRVLGRDPDQARQALGAIEDLGREGLAELRRLLGMLHPAENEDGGEPPSLAHVGALAERMRRTGLPVEVTVEGSPRPLPAGLDLSAYRVVQEALTNAVRHAGPAHARVRLRYAPDSVEVEVTDDGAAPPVRAPQEPVGRGLIGMRERVALYGGTLTAGPAPGGGFGVRARFPLATALPAQGGQGSGAA